MTTRLCACYKCVVSGRSWNLTVTDFIRDRPLVQACGRTTEIRTLFAEPGEDRSKVKSSSNECLLALYFGAASCDTCRLFANELWNAQELLWSTGGHRLEVLYISSDRDICELFDFMKLRHRWYALRFDDPAASDLRSFLSVRDLPSLVIVDEVGLVSRSGRRDLHSLGPAVAWHKWIARRRCPDDDAKRRPAVQFESSLAAASVTAVSDAG